MKTSTSEITNSEDIIDSRDVIARIEYLRDELDACLEAVIGGESDEDREKALSDLAEWLGCEAGDLPDSFAAINGDFPLKNYQGSDEAQELAALEALASEVEGYGDWHHGEALIRDSYFTEYAQQLADDIGAIDRNAKWPTNHIDWEAAADELKQDYMEVSFNGTTYFMRA
jgi:hypothetical protein